MDELQNNKFLMKLPVPKKKFIWGLLRFLLGQSALHQSGWIKSWWKEAGVDRKGSPIPWITYPLINLLNQRLNKSMSVFEYGSGNSTAWWASHVKNVISLEYDEKWYEKVKPTLPSNAKLEFIPVGQEYPRAATKQGHKFDIIMIDGRMRNECAVESLKALKNKGVIVWDNTDRQKYQKGIKYLKNNGFKQLEFVGMIPSSNKLSETSIFYKEDNILNI